MWPEPSGQLPEAPAIDTWVPEVLCLLPPAPGGGHSLPELPCTAGTWAEKAKPASSPFLAPPSGQRAGLRDQHSLVGSRQRGIHHRLPVPPGSVPAGNRWDLLLLLRGPLASQSHSPESGSHTVSCLPGWRDEVVSPGTIKEDTACIWKPYRKGGQRAESSGNKLRRQMLSLRFVGGFGVNR